MPSSAAAPGGANPFTLIRRAALGDAAAMCEVNMRSIRISAAGHYTAAQLEAWAGPVSVERCERIVAETIAFVAVDLERVVGFANLDVADGELDQLYVDPAAGGRGVARALVQAVEGAAIGHRLREVHTRASLRAEPAFERLGYRVVERELHPANGQVFARAHMVKTLG